MNIVRKKKVVSSRDKFSDFVSYIRYFEGKINCHNRRICTYDEYDAKQDIKEKLEEYGCLDSVLEHDRYDWESDEDKLEEFYGDVLEDFSMDTGIGSKGYDALSAYMDDVWEFASDIGKRETGILDLYMIAFKLAKEQLENNQS